MRKLIAVLALCGFFAFSAPAYSQVHIRVHLAPPALRIETIPARPQPTAVWTPGYYRFDTFTQSYVWVPGSYQIPPARQLVWMRPRYIERMDGTYDYYRGHWATPREARREEAQEARSR